MATTISLAIQVTPAADPPPVFARLVYAASTPEADHTGTVSLLLLLLLFVIVIFYCCGCGCGSFVVNTSH